MNTHIPKGDQRNTAVHLHACMHMSTYLPNVHAATSGKTVYLPSQLRQPGKHKHSQPEKLRQAPETVSLSVLTQCLRAANVVRNCVLQVCATVVPAQNSFKGNRRRGGQKVATAVRTHHWQPDSSTTCITSPSRWSPAILHTPKVLCVEVARQGSAAKRLQQRLPLQLATAHTNTHMHTASLLHGGTHRLRIHACRKRQGPPQLLLVAPTCPVNYHNQTPHPGKQQLQGQRAQCVQHIQYRSYISRTITRRGSLSVTASTCS